MKLLVHSQTSTVQPFVKACISYVPFANTMRYNCSGMRHFMPNEQSSMMTSSNENIFPYWPFVRGIHRWPVYSPHKGQWRAALMFSLICSWINGWVNNSEARDLRRRRAHYDVSVVVLLRHPTWHGHVLNPNYCPLIGKGNPPVTKGTPSHKVPVMRSLDCSFYVILNKLLTAQSIWRRS